MTDREILSFFQLLLLAGSETTTNLINNAILCFIENPDQLARLRSEPALLPSAIEEVLGLVDLVFLTARDVPACVLTLMDDSGRTLSELLGR